MTPPPLRRPDSLETPRLLLDRVRLDRNIERMEARATELGVALRPHLKTAKSQDIAMRTPSVRKSGATVSTVREAEAFADATEQTILYARTPSPEGIARLARLGGRAARPLGAIDSIESLRAFEHAASIDPTPLGVLIEIDCGEHRSGLRPDDHQLPQLIAEVIRRPRLELCGVFTHGGQSYGARSITEIAAVAEQERAAVVAAAEVFARLGADCPIRSVGSTPTVTHAEHYDGCTEARAGVYVFQDLFQVGVGSCGVEDIALSVVTSVIGKRARERRLLIDAGGLALSKDRSTGAFADLAGESTGLGDCGYGLVCDLEGQLLDGLRVVEAWQEHGVVEALPGFDLDVDRFPIGTKLRVLPNHACMTAAAHEGYHVIGEGGSVEAFWPRVNGWS